MEKSLRIFIGGIAAREDTEVIEAYFKQFGTITNCKIKRNKKNGRCLGFGFITCGDQETHAKIIAQKTHTVNGRVVECKENLKKEKLSNNIEKEKNRKLFVSGLPHYIKNEELLDYFLKFGVVVNAYVICKPGSDESKGFGFVHFETDKQAQDALDFPNHEIDHVEMIVSRFKNKKEQREHRVKKEDSIKQETAPLLFSCQVALPNSSCPKKLSPRESTSSGNSGKGCDSQEELLVTPNPNIGAKKSLTEASVETHEIDSIFVYGVCPAPKLEKTDKVVFESNLKKEMISKESFSPNGSSILLSRSTAPNSGPTSFSYYPNLFSGVKPDSPKGQMGKCFGEEEIWDDFLTEFQEPKNDSLPTRRLFSESICSQEVKTVHSKKEMIEKTGIWGPSIVQKLINKEQGSKKKSSFNLFD